MKLRCGECFNWETVADTSMIGCHHTLCSHCSVKIEKCPLCHVDIDPIKTAVFDIECQPDDTIKNDEIRIRVYDMDRVQPRRKRHKLFKRRVYDESSSFALKNNAQTKIKPRRKTV